MVCLGHVSPARCTDVTPLVADATAAPHVAADNEGWFDGWRPRSFLAERLGRSRKPPAPPDGSIVLVAGQEQLPPPLPELGACQERRLNDPYLGGGLEANNAYVAPLPAYADIPVPSDGGGYYADDEHRHGRTVRMAPAAARADLSQLSRRRERIASPFVLVQRHGRNLWDLTLGGNVGLIRYGTRGNVRPEG